MTTAGEPRPPRAGQARRAGARAARRAPSSLVSAVAVAALLAAGCTSAAPPAGPAANTRLDIDSGPAAAAAEHTPAMIGAGLVDIGGGRQLSVECRGEGSPTVILIAGKGNGGDDWSQVLDPADGAHKAPGDDVGAGFGDIHPGDDAVLPSVARFTRVCTYDRPDTGVERADQSTPRTQPHTLDLDVEDLHALLPALGERGPVVLVAHSYAGLIATQFARTYPHQVAALVMVDAATEHIADVIGAEKLANWDAVNRATSTQVREGVEVIDAIERINAAPQMPTVPTVVLTADKPYRTDLLPPEVNRDSLVSFADWQAAQARLASALSATHITQTNSGHNIYLYSPALVVEAIEEVIRK